MSDACFLAKKPLVTAAVGIFDGTLTTIRAHERGKDGKPNPTYRCLFPEPPPAGSIPACAEAGILGALPGVLGSMMALEVIREIVGFGEGLIGRLLMVDARAMRFETLNYEWDPEQSALAAKSRASGICRSTKVWSAEPHCSESSDPDAASPSGDAAYGCCLLQLATVVAPFITAHLPSRSVDW